MTDQEFNYIVNKNSFNIRQWKIENWSNLSIAKRLGLRGKNSRLKLYAYLDSLNPPTIPVMGHKNVPYYPGEEIHPPEYNWDDISKEEKGFYNNYCPKTS